MPAFMICQLYFEPLLGVGDVRITDASPEAATLFGVAHAQELVDTFLSDRQDYDWREYGRMRWALRKLGYRVPQDYCTVVQSPEGQMIPQRRELVSACIGRGGEETYVMRVSPVREVDHLPNLRLFEDYGVEKAEAELYMGQRSVAQLRSQLATDALSLPFGERFTIILDKLASLVKRKVLDMPTALDAALHPQIGWSLDAKKAPMVTVHQTCPRCGWRWYYTGEAAPNQCPRCRLRPDTGQAR